MKVVYCMVALMVVAGATTGASARTHGVTLRDRQEAACYKDAQRLCGEFIPNVDKISACMEVKKAEVSGKCRTMMDATY